MLVVAVVAFHVVVANTLDCDTIESKFKLQSLYYTNI